MPATSTRPRRAEVRTQILAAAAAAFFEHGYAETTVSDIAAAAGFTKGAVYSNFTAGKPELFVAVFAERAASITELAIAESELQAAGGSASAFAAALAQALTSHVTSGAAGPAALAEFRSLAVRDEAVRTAYAELRLRQRRQVEDQLRSRAPALGLPATFDYPVAANLLLTVANGLATEHAAAPAATPPQLIAASLAQLLQSLLPEVRTPS